MVQDLSQINLVFSVVCNQTWVLSFFLDIISLSISLFLKGYSILSSIQEILGIYLLSLSLSYILKPDIYLAKDRSPVILKFSCEVGFAKRWTQIYVELKNIVIFLHMFFPSNHLPLKHDFFVSSRSNIFSKYTKNNKNA